MLTCLAGGGLLTRGATLGRPGKKSISLTWPAVSRATTKKKKTTRDKEREREKPTYG